MSGPNDPNLSRRGLLGLGAAAAAAPLLTSASSPAQGAPVPRGLFSLGVASGDPLPDGFVLWTRLAPEPLAPDGAAGMPPHSVPVQWQVATDPSFRSVARRGTTVATPQWNHSVHVDVQGLQPGREYWYRFRAAGQISTVGRAVTAPAVGAAVGALSFAFASCQNYPEGYFTAFGDIALQDLDLIVHLGDYIYEGAGASAIGRSHLPTHEVFSLADYRIRHTQYRTDPDLQLAHAHAPWIAILDDHEVENDWAGDISQPDNEPDQDPVVFRQRRAAAYQAYWENMPMRRASRPSGPEMRLFRSFTYGDLLHLDVLDTRRYRDDQILGCAEPCDARWDPNRQMLGEQQEAWLLDSLGRSQARWNVLGNQVYMSDSDHTAGPGESYSTDTWANYAGARQRLFAGLRDREVDNFVVITGDAHRSVAGDLLADFRDDASAVVGAEFLGTSISSGGNGSDQDALGKVWLDENPYMKFHNKQRGYQVCRLDHRELVTEYRVIDQVTRPGGTVTTRAKAYVEAGRPGVAQIES
ncbi:alkaline phosphatase D family protein [Luteipulveratus halotolerans]|uniref:Alkaline phosphatase n=1 Tax=Luteipulveratus halotolerans TaxID=1631356 RepID=A0A0L6CFC4_9MICO|nr:alkaline phosphatase D family protein [Luteipulveratus halotolerans]KNX36228.1 alkaline phosphatase [Luteipulveratus halotolerans]